MTQTLPYTTSPSKPKAGDSITAMKTIGAESKVPFVPSFSTDTSSRDHDSSGSSNSSNHENDTNPRTGVAVILGVADDPTDPTATEVTVVRYVEIPLWPVGDVTPDKREGIKDQNPKKRLTSLNKRDSARGNQEEWSSDLEPPFPSPVALGRSSTGARPGTKLLSVQYFGPRANTYAAWKNRNEVGCACNAAQYRNNADKYEISRQGDVSRMSSLTSDEDVIRGEKETPESRVSAPGSPTVHFDLQPVIIRQSERELRTVCIWKSTVNSNTDENFNTSIALRGRRHEAQRKHRRRDQTPFNFDNFKMDISDSSKVTRNVAGSAELDKKETASFTEPGQTPVNYKEYHCSTCTTKPRMTYFENGASPNCLVTTLMAPRGRQHQKGEKARRRDQTPFNPLRFETFADNGNNDCENTEKTVSWDIPVQNCALVSRRCGKGTQTTGVAEGPQTAPKNGKNSVVAGTTINSIDDGSCRTTSGDNKAGGKTSQTFSWRPLALWIASQAISAGLAAYYT